MWVIDWAKYVLCLDLSVQHFVYVSVSRLRPQASNNRHEIWNQHTNSEQRICIKFFIFFPFKYSNRFVGLLQSYSNNVLLFSWNFDSLDTFTDQEKRGLCFDLTDWNFVCVFVCLSHDYSQLGHETWNQLTCWKELHM